jgi:hypothetical protein
MYIVAKKSIHKAFDTIDFNKISITISKNEYILDTKDILLYN